jgi:hypothetical protein
VILGFRRRVNGVFSLVGYYAVLTGSYRRFGIACRSHLEGYWYWFYLIFKQSKIVEDRTDRLSRNVDNKLPINAA